MWQPLKSKNITSKQESQPFRVASVIEKVGAGGLRNRLCGAGTLISLSLQLLTQIKITWQY